MTGLDADDEIQITGLNSASIVEAEDGVITVDVNGDGTAEATFFYQGDGSVFTQSYADGTVTLTDNGAFQNTPATGAVMITGSAEIGETLSADTSAVADANGLGTFVYQWQRDGVDIAGATGATYDVDAADDAAEISVLVSFVDGDGTLEELAPAMVTVGADVTGDVIIGTSGDDILDSTSLR